ncbi:serine endoprotease DegQ, partial [Erwinia amylovora]|nr:serine endoprotease DegQ [Erwinia amylovora]
MNKKSYLLIALALSISLQLNVASAVGASLPTQLQGQQLPSLAPMLEMVLPAVVSVHVEGEESASQQQPIPEPLKRFFDQNGEVG